MLIATSFSLFFGFWASLFFVDFFFKTSSTFSTRYANFLNSYGLSVSIAQVRWFTTYFNRFFIKLGTRKSSILKLWFSLGVIFSLVLMLLSSALLVMIVFNTFFKQERVDQQILTPVMPGVNLPASQIGYYLLTLLICGVFHELGHAIAAAGEEVRVNGFGLFIMALYPGAFVDVNSTHIESISPLRQLRIFCAGVWHNIVIVLVALVVLFLLPVLLFPFYKSGHGVIISEVAKDSPVSGVNGASVGDLVTFVNKCPVRNVEEWASCVTNIAMKPPIGYCTSQRSVVQHYNITTNPVKSNENVECCKNSTDSHLCFQNFSTPKLISKHDYNYICMTVRSVVEGEMCSTDDDCYKTGERKSSSDKFFCLVPSVGNSTWLMQVTYGSSKLPLLFLGHPYTLYYYITVTNHEPRFPILSLHMPYITETFCKYLVSLSGALAIINIIPCYALDGQWIIEAICNCVLPRFVKDVSSRNLIYTSVVLSGTLLVITNVLIALWTLFLK